MHNPGEPRHISGSRGAIRLPQRPEWTSQRAFIIASVASAVGLGNIWRFPYMVGENGGGTFIAAYAICILGVGLPLFIIETSAGSLFDRGPVGVFRGLAGGMGKWLGWLAVGMAVAIMSYYLAITGWTLGYFVDAVGSSLKSFDEFTSGYTPVWYFLLVAVMVFLVLSQGMGGIERLGKILMPILVLMVGLLAMYSQSLDGAAEARSFYTSFDMDTFLQLRTWQMAAGQAFYSLGVGTGVLITYGSYIPRNVNIVASSTAVALANSAISLTAGIVVFSIVYTFDIAPDTGSQLSFVAFPRIFDEVAGGTFIAAAFFGLLFVAAFSSCYSLLTVLMAPLRDEFHLRTKPAALLATGITTVLGIPSALSFSAAGLSVGGKPILDWVDLMSGSGVVIAVGIVGAAVIAWRMPRLSLTKEMDVGMSRARATRPIVHGIVEIGRYMPVAAVMLILITMMVKLAGTS